ncbi:MAG TPA: hypothetical protein VM802_21260 [Chitinophaga sp.]|uniref:hypothetical protein n=1 Tax=Chitinophaga sp. TaxID=1869181 RepID=UPI002C1A1398|nr:hypothetical protein [Chitinophaga sp.]HVI47416.1 hypothetical protein [Chitinophaga sp.]
MKKLMLTLFCTQQTLVLCAQSLLAPLGKDNAGGSYSRHFQDVFTAAYSPAGLSCIAHFSAGAYAERRFMLAAIPLYALSVAVPARSGAFGAGVVRAGNSFYYQQRVSSAYGRTIGKRAGIGVQFNYITETLRGYGARDNFSFDLGVLFHISEKVHAGAVLSRTADRQLDYSVGVGFEASRDCLLSSSLVKAGGEPAWVKVAAYYKIVPRLALQLGVATQPPYNNAAVVLQLRTFRLITGAGFHPQLGITPSTAIIWQQASAE